MDANLIKNAGRATAGLALALLMVAPAATAVSLGDISSFDRASVQILRPYPGATYMDGRLYEGIENRRALLSDETPDVVGRFLPTISYACNLRAREASLHVTLLRPDGSVHGTLHYMGTGPVRGIWHEYNLQPSRTIGEWTLEATLHCYTGNPRTSEPMRTVATSREFQWAPYLIE